MTCRTILLMILALVFSTPLYADMAAANYELNRGNFKAAAKEFTRLAETGDVQAQSYLGYMYFVGQGVTQDYGEAVRWYRKAAKQGDMDAEYNLAVAYAFGQGVQKDLNQATKWYLKAAEQGHAAAEYSLGISYANGEGVKQDIEEAIKWFSKAAGQGYAGAQKALDSLRKQDATAAAKQGTGTSTEPKDKEELLNMDGINPSLPGAETPANILLEQTPATAASAEPAKAAATVAAQDETVQQKTPSSDRLYVGTGQPAAEIKQDVTPEFKSLDESAIDSAAPVTAETGAISATEADAAAGKEGAGSFLKRLFGSRQAQASAETPATDMSGDDDTDDMAAEPAQTAISDNSGKDEKKGLLSRLFGSSGSKVTENEIAPKQEQDAGTEQPKVDPSLYKRGMAALANKSYRDAATLFHEAAIQDDPGSQFQLGSLFYQGLGVSRDYNEAKRWYQRAADNGNADAQYSLGNMYLMGEGVEQNDQKAMYWYKKATDQGHDAARHNLENLKEIISKAGEKPGIAAGDAPATAAAGSDTIKEKPKQGFFSRLFGKDKPEAGKQSAQGATTQQSKPIAAGNSGKKTEENPSFMSKEGGGLFGHLFGWGKNKDGQNVQKTVSAKDKQDAAAAAAPSQDSSTEQPAADAKKENGKDKPSYMSKEGGGLFGHLFGWGQQKDNAGDSVNDNSSNSSPSSEQPAGGEDQSSAAEDYRKGLAYSQGNGVAKDAAQAFTWFMKSAEQGYAQAQYQVGVAFASGMGTAKDLSKAVYWYDKSATRGHITAQRNLADMYAKGEGVKQDKTQALAWYSILAESGNPIDIQRRDILAKELSPKEIATSHVIVAELKSEIESAAR